MRTNDLVRFIKERDGVRIRKEAGKPRPWTKDPILDKYRFCNVHREDDRVTRWLRTNWYPQFSAHEDLWFAAIVARLLNLPESLEAVKDCILPWKPEKFRKILHERKEAGQKNFNAAYIVSTNGNPLDKVVYITYNILGFLWSERRNMRPKITDTLDVYHKMLMGFDGLGSFMAAQVVADLKYLPPLNHALDWMTFAASGPGSRRGLNRIFEWDPNQSWNEGVWRAHLRQLLEAVNKKLPEPLHAQDLQNCLCEFDKYERARLGEGTPKQIYKEEKSNG